MSTESAQPDAGTDINEMDLAAVQAEIPGRESQASLKRGDYYQS
jgi:hypothetical protein